jgi:hypothetical protein
MKYTLVWESLGSEKIIFCIYPNPISQVKVYDVQKPGFYGKFIILTNGVYEETGFLGSESVSPVFFEIT